MLAHPTVDLLHALGLHGMAKGFTELAAQPEAASLEHAEWLALLLEHEATLRRQKRFESRARAARLRQAASVEDVELILDLPIVMPPSVAGLALLIAFGRNGLFGPALNILGISLPFTTAAVVFAQTFVAAPLYVRSARIGFSEIDHQLEEAAHVEGANQWQLFYEVMVPLAGRVLASGAILTWTRALGEFGATILFAGNLQGITQTMPMAIYLGFESNLGVALVLSVVLIFVSIIVLTATKKLEKHEY